MRDTQAPRAREPLFETRPPLRNIPYIGYDSYLWRESPQYIMNKTKDKNKTAAATSETVTPAPAKKVTTFTAWTDGTETAPMFGETSMSKTKRMTVEGKEVAITFTVDYAEIGIEKPVSKKAKIYHGGGLNGMLQHTVSSMVSSGKVTTSKVTLDMIDAKPDETPEQAKARQAREVAKALTNLSAEKMIELMKAAGLA
jgi:hypothetical protein